MKNISGKLITYLTTVSTILIFISAPLKAQMNKNIEAFSKLYGYVKYFHPSDEASAIDWDAFAVYGCQQVENCQTDTELLVQLNNIFKPIAPSVQIYLKDTNKSFQLADITPNNIQEYNCISWQHEGVHGYYDQTMSIYKSARLNRKPNLHQNRKSFCNFEVPKTNKLSGETIRIQIDIKTDSLSIGSSGEFSIMIKNKMNAWEYKTIAQTVLNTNTDWKTYTLQDSIGKQWEVVHILPQLNGSGCIQFDNFQIEVKSGNEWLPFFSDSFESYESIDAYESEKNKAYRHNYGVLYNVEFKNKSSNKYMEIKSSYADYTLLNKPLYPQETSIGTHIQKQLSDSISCIVPLAVYGNKYQTYPKADTTNFSKLIANISTCTFSHLNEQNQKHYYLGAFVATWNLFQHFFPYHQYASVNWNTQLSAGIKLMSECKNDQEMIDAFRYLLSPLNDGHISVYNYRAYTNNHYSLPFEWSWVQNKLVVTKTHSKIDMQQGDIILSIDDTPADNFINEKRNYVSAANHEYALSVLLKEALYGDQGTTVKLQVKDGQGQLKTINTKRNIYRGKLLQESGATIKKLENGLYYVNLCKANESSLLKNLNKLKQSKGIIFDMRGNESGAAYAVINNLLSEDKLLNTPTKPWFQVPRYLYPNQEKVSYYTPEWKSDYHPQKEVLHTNVAFLINEKCISHTETHLALIKHYKLGLLIGKPTAATNGNVNTMRFMRLLTINYTGMRTNQLDGSQFHKVGIKPDIEVWPSIKGIRQNKDETLEKAVSVLSSK